MPIHDWTRVPAGLFHDFHQSWSIRIKDALNSGILPEELSALVEQRSGPKESDVLTVDTRGKETRLADSSGLLTVERPTAHLIRRTTKQIYAGRANRIVVKHHLGRTVAVIEIVSPGNKDTPSALRDFTEKTLDFLRRGIHVLVVDLFPPTKRDPFGIHKVIWDEIESEDFAFPPGKDRIVVSYESDDEKVAYVNLIGVGDPLPETPLFLAPGIHVRVPLESTYGATWNATPKVMRIAVQTGVLPEVQAEE